MNRSAPTPHDSYFPSWLLDAPFPAAFFSASNFVIEAANARYLELFKKDKTILGKPLLQVLPEIADQTTFTNLERAYHSGAASEEKEQIRLRQANGADAILYLDMYYKPIPDARKNILGVLVTGYDITGHIQQLEESEARFRMLAVDVNDEIRTREKLEKSQTLLIQLADQMPQLVWMAEGNGSVTYYNKRVSEFAGFRVTSDGRYIWEGVVHPDDADATTEAWNTAVKHLTKYEIEHRIQMKDGSYRWHLSRAYPYHTDAGIKWYGTATDVHDSKVMEMNLEELVNERTLALQRSNDDLQQFAHVASHDLKEPVRKIKTFSYKLQDEFRSILGERGNTFINKILHATDRMNAMIHGVLEYASMNSVSGVTEQVNLNHVIKNIKIDLELLIDEKQAAIIFEDLPTVRGIPELIHQLFYNLINNSLKFSRKETPSRIEISSRVVRVGDVPFEEIVVSDNGIGFDSKYAEQIFSTFIRLNSKDKYEGSGLGLPLCKKIVERHGGSISAESEPGQGATFRILLPK